MKKNELTMGWFDDFDQMVKSSLWIVLWNDWFSRSNNANDICLWIFISGDVKECMFFFTSKVCFIATKNDWKNICAISRGKSEIFTFFKKLIKDNELMFSAKFLYSTVATALGVTSRQLSFISYYLRKIRGNRTLPKAFF